LDGFLLLVAAQPIVKADTTFVLIAVLRVCCQHDEESARISSVFSPIIIIAELGVGRDDDARILFLLVTTMVVILRQ